MPDEAQYFVTYYAGGEVLYQDERAPMVPAIGTGVHFSGIAYRVSDVWLNYEKHAPVDWGIAVFLARAELGEGFSEVGKGYYSPARD